MRTTSSALSSSEHDDGSAPPKPFAFVGRRSCRHAPRGLSQASRARRTFRSANLKVGQVVLAIRAISLQSDFELVLGLSSHSLDAGGATIAPVTGIQSNGEIAVHGDPR